MANEVKVDISIEEQQALAALVKLIKGINKVDDAVENLGKNKGFLSQQDLIFGATKKVEKLKKSSKDLESQWFATAKGFLAARGIEIAIQAVSQAFRESFQQAREFSKAVAEINTLLPKNGKITNELKEELLGLGQSFATGPQEQAKAYYQIISSGAAQGAEAVEILAQANLLATGGLADITGSVSIITDILNVYGKENITAAEAADSLFQTVKLGKTTISELNSSLGQVLPSAQKLGVGLDEVGAALATMTTQGLTTSERTTQLNALFTALFRNSGDAAEKFGDKVGEAFSLKALRDKKLPLFLEDLQKATGGNEIILQKLLGRTEAVRAIFALTGQQTGKLTKNIEEFTKKAGAAADASKIVKDNLDFQLERAGKNTIAYGQAVLDNIEKPLLAALKAFNSLTGEISNKDPFKNVRNLNQAQENLVALTRQLEGARSAEGTFFSLFTADIGETEEKIERLRKKIAELSEVEPLVLAPDERGQGDPFANLITGKENYVTVSASQQAAITEDERKENEKRIAIDNAAQEQKEKNAAEARVKRQEAAASALKERIAQEKKAIEALAQLEMQQRIVDEETRLAAREFDDAEEEATFVALEEKLGRESAIKLQAAENIANTEVEIKKSQLDTEKALLSQKIKNEEAAAKRQKGILDELLSAEKVFNKSKAQGQRDTLNLIAGAMGSHNTTIFRAAQAAAVATATIDGVSAVQSALADFMFPANLAIAAIVGGISAANIANIVSTKPPAKAEGGFISPSLSQVGDQTAIRVNGDEFVANRSQQRNIINNVANGQLSGGGAGVAESINNLAMQLASQPIIISVDSKEIARATREGVTQGIAI